VAGEIDERRVPGPDLALELDQGAGAHRLAVGERADARGQIEQLFAQLEAIVGSPQSFGLEAELLERCSVGWLWGKTSTASLWTW